MHELTWNGRKLVCRTCTVLDPIAPPPWPEIALYGITVVVFVGVMIWLACHAH